MIGKAASERQETVIVNGCTKYQKLTVETSKYNLATSKNAVNVKTSERCFNDRIDREVSNVVNTVEDRIQNAILTSIDSLVAPEIELKITSKNPSSGRDRTSVTANSDHGEHVGTTEFFGDASENNIVLHISIVNDETRKKDIQGEVSK